MRCGGATFQTIADEVGYESRQSARYAVQSTAARIATNGRGITPGRFYNWLMLSVLDRLLTAFFDQALAGDPKALDAVLAIMERQHQLTRRGAAGR